MVYKNKRRMIVESSPSTEKWWWKSSVDWWFDWRHSIFIAHSKCIDFVISIHNFKKNVRHSYWFNSSSFSQMDVVCLSIATLLKWHNSLQWNNDNNYHFCTMVVLFCFFFLLLLTQRPITFFFKYSATI